MLFKSDSRRSKMVLRPEDVDFDARKLRDLEVTEALGVEVKGGAYNTSSKSVPCACVISDAAISCTGGCR